MLLDCRDRSAAASPRGEGGGRYEVLLGESSARPRSNADTRSTRWGQGVSGAAASAAVPVPVVPDILLRVIPLESAAQGARSDTSLFFIVSHT